MCAEFGIGTIGAGFMGSNVLEVLRLAPDTKMEVRAICRTNKQKLDQISRVLSTFFLRALFLRLLLSGRLDPCIPKRFCP